jgi:hypothetical protein
MTSLTRRLFCACVLILVAAGLYAGPVLSQPLLCGNRYVNTTYVLPGNCLKACLNKGHTLADCKITLVPLCEACWKKLTICATAPFIPPPFRCTDCTAQYAQCIKPFL